MKQIRIFAFGGNEVSPVGLKDKDGKAINPDIAMQWQRTAETGKLVADIFEKHPEDRYVMTHGNGPQVGNVLQRAEMCRPALPPLPLDVCVADTQGAMAFMLAQLNNELNIRGIDNIVAGIVTQVVVDKDDPDFKNPSKYIGQSYTAEEAKQRTAEGWTMKLYKKDASGKEIWRRVVPSPVPVDIVEIDAIEALLDKGIVPITVGGGGIPVREVTPEVKDGRETYTTNYNVKFTKPAKGAKALKMYTGVEAVIDKDLASALLGNMLMKRAKARGEKVEVSLTIFTGEDGAKLNYQKPDEKSLRVIKVSELEAIYNQVPPPFPAGSMGPKIKAVIEFVKGGGSVAYISKTDLFEETLAGKAGTTVLPG
ncbi:MAG: carbamate kinase [Elusimicrobiales bacterium]|nr:carbamate kinase [Elusimicrobiales bacterium]